MELFFEVVHLVLRKQRETQRQIELSLVARMAAEIIYMRWKQSDLERAPRTPEIWNTITSMLADDVYNGMCIIHETLNNSSGCS